MKKHRKMRVCYDYDNQTDDVTGISELGDKKGEMRSKCWTMFPRACRKRPEQLQAVKPRRGEHYRRAQRESD